MVYREYSYIGSDNILKNLPESSIRMSVQSPDDILKWMDKYHQTDYPVTVTFIIDTQERLWINERRSEHVLCAAGGNVLSAGEMTFNLSESVPSVIAVTNQSTGYCPEPESWWIVENTLNNANIKHPGAFTMAYLFRKCENCGTKNIVKDSWFYCGVCDAELSQQWNFDL
ncbi:MAG: hypothetical protein ACPG7F_01080 [Aggregatilineales bacterium]